MAALRAVTLLATAAALAPPVSERVVTLKDGQRMQWLSCEPSTLNPFAPPPPTCVFVHGTFHGAWCWAEKWLPRFAGTHGIAAHALSLRGTSASPYDKPVKLSQHAADLGEAIAALGLERPPHLVAHSFGGPVILDAVNEGLDAAGLALLCSVPPSGNGPGVRRVLFRSLGEAWLITRAFALKTAGTNPDDANAIFFNGELDGDAAARYAARFRADGETGLDLRDYTKSLPRWPVDAAGAWTKAAPKALVVGCGADRVVDDVAVRETGAFLRAEPTTLPGAPHDLMLADVADDAADLVAAWVAG